MHHHPGEGMCCTSKKACADSAAPMPARGHVPSAVVQSGALVPAGTALRSSALGNRAEGPYTTRLLLCRRQHAPQQPAALSPEARQLRAEYLHARPLLMHADLSMCRGMHKGNDTDSHLRRMRCLQRHKVATQHHAVWSTWWGGSLCSDVSCTQM